MMNTILFLTSTLLFSPFHKEVVILLSVVTFTTMINLWSHNFWVTMISPEIFNDSLSVNLIILSMWITCLVKLVGSEWMKTPLPQYFIFLSTTLLIFLVLSFSVLSFMWFYVCFEICLIPIFLMILGWGYQPERLNAGLYLMFYTLLGSLPLLLVLVYLFTKLKSSCLLILLSSNNSPLLCLNTKNLNTLLFLFSLVAFLVKFPMYFLHLWLPKAHVEAPAYGSMYLAGILLKLGGYGLIRVSQLWENMIMTWSYFILSIALTGGIFASLVCLRQTDMKSLVAYSSVVHMGLVLCGISTMKMWGMNGAIVIMIGHGLCSSGLFFLVSLVYERSLSRSFFINKGLLMFMPSMCLWWFLFVISNMAAPPSLNLLGEVSVFIGLLSWSILSILSLMLISFLSAVYCVFLYSFSQTLKSNISHSSFSQNKMNEFFILFLHWTPLNVIVMKPNILY